MVTLANPQLGTKAFVPRFARPWVSRDRLLRRLRDRPAVVVISGPPGAGKTGLLAEFYSESCQSRGTWLTLDARDNEPGRLGALVATATGFPLPPLGRDADLALVDAVLAECSAAGAERVLVLDDVHELTARHALAALDHLLLRAPECLSVVLASRADPPVSLARLRAEGRLREIRAGELAFTAAETSELLANYGVELALADCAVLRDRTEGWAAGLRLAAIALESEEHPARFVADAARTEAVVSDYLLREVFERQSADRREFLLRTSVVDRMCTDLARHLSDDPDPLGQLDALERDGVFLTAVDDRRTLFRYHALFGALLRARFREQRPDEAEALMGRAAQWFAARGMVEDAETMARRAGDWQMLGTLLCDRWLRASAAGPVDRCTAFELPLDAAAEIASLGVLAYAQAVSRQDRAAADHWRSHTAVADPRVALIRDLLDVWYGRVFGVADGALEACARVRARPGADEELCALKAAVLVGEAELRLGLGDGDAALELLVRARAEAHERGTQWVADEASSWIGFIAACRGEPADAEKALSDRSCAEAVGREAANVADALVQSARGRGARAVGVLMAPDATRRSSALVRDAAALVSDVLDPRGTRSAIPATRDVLLDVLVALGDVDRVAEAGAGVRFASERAVARARRLLPTGREDALVIDVLAAAPRGENAHPRTRVELNLLGALAADRLGDEQSALEWLEHALAAAQPDDLRGPFLAHGRDAAGLLERYGWQLGAAQPYCVDILDDVRRSEPPVFVEPLTERERAVLGYLPTMMSNVEIAHELFVSVNTVKTHLKAVYRKLGVERRRDAVLRARQLEIL